MFQFSTLNLAVGIELSCKIVAVCDCFLRVRVCVRVCLRVRVCVCVYVCVYVFSIELWYKSCHSQREIH